MIHFLYKLHPCISVNLYLIQCSNIIYIHVLQLMKNLQIFLTVQLSHEFFNFSINFISRDSSMMSSDSGPGTSTFLRKGNFFDLQCVALALCIKKRYLYLYLCYLLLSYYYLYLYWCWL